MHDLHETRGCCESCARSDIENAVYLHSASVDMRKQIDGLVILANVVTQQDPTSRTLFGVYQCPTQ
jgi:hypothetical protein